MTTSEAAKSISDWEDAKDQPNLVELASATGPVQRKNTSPKVILPSSTPNDNLQLASTTGSVRRNITCSGAIRSAATYNNDLLLASATGPVQRSTTYAGPIVSLTTSNDNNTLPARPADVEKGTLVTELASPNLSLLQITRYHHDHYRHYSHQQDLWKWSTPTSTALVLLMCAKSA